MSVGETYKITGIERVFPLKNGSGQGIIVKTLDGLKRSTAVEVIKQLTSTETSFPVKAKLISKKSAKTGRMFQLLEEIE